MEKLKILEDILMNLKPCEYYIHNMKDSTGDKQSAVKHLSLALYALEGLIIDVREEV